MEKGKWLHLTLVLNYKKATKEPLAKGKIRK